MIEAEEKMLKGEITAIAVSNVNKSKGSNYFG